MFIFELQSSWLMRPLAAAVGSGSLSGVVVALARELIRGDPWVHQVVESCPLLDLPQDWQLDFRSLVIGLAVGFVFLPVLDLLLVARLQWLRWIRQHAALANPGRPLFRVVG